MDFKTIKQAVEAKFNAINKDYEHLYEADIDEDKVWNLYLDTIPEKFNQIFNVRREYDCSSCRHFIKRASKIVAFDGGEIITIWDVETEDDNWNMVAKTISDYIKSCNIVNVFYTSQRIIGAKSNRIHINDNVFTFDHFYGEVSIKFYDVESIVSSFKSDTKGVHDVLVRGLKEFTSSTFDCVIELINTNSIYRGEEFLNYVKGFKTLLAEYNKLKTDKDKDIFAWEHIWEPCAKIRNTAIGTLLIDIENGVGLDEAVSKYEKIVAPENYKRSKPIFTQRMLDEAKNKITELGYLESIPRRFATADDITVNNILFINRDVKTTAMDDDDIFGSMSKMTKKSPKKFTRVKEIGIQEFVDTVLPTATKVEAYVENKHKKNFVSLIAPVNPDSKSMFKWGNGFSWTYTGNLTDSVLKQNVKNAGGNVNGVLRFSIMWNDDPASYNRNDEDAHCVAPNGKHIFFANKETSFAKLDVDIIEPYRGTPAVENIIFNTLDKMPEGVYHFFVNTYTCRGGRGGFRAEIECNGEIRSYDYSIDSVQDQRINVADVMLKDGEFVVQDKLDSSVTKQDIWGIESNDFVPVSCVCYSPNCWDGNKVGNRHYFFLLQGCKNDEEPNGFYNEFLNSDLYPAHRKVFEALGSMTHVKTSENQLSGLGFSSTQKADIVVRVTSDSVERMFKVVF